MYPPSASACGLGDIKRLGGGGHVKAAGCQVCGTADEVRNILLDAVQKEWSNA